MPAGQPTFLLSFLHPWHAVFTRSVGGGLARGGGGAPCASSVHMSSFKSHRVQLSPPVLRASFSKGA
jgi:hypothetical protein